MFSPISYKYANYLKSPIWPGQFQANNYFVFVLFSLRQLICLRAGQSEMCCLNWSVLDTLANSARKYERQLSVVLHLG